MKMFRKITAFFLFAVMVLAMSCTALATEDKDTPAQKKQADMKDHEFTAYQIFAGENDGKTLNLKKVSWGNGINPGLFLADLKADSLIGEEFEGIDYVADDSNKVKKSAEEVAKVVSGWSDDSDFARAFAKIADKNKTGDGYKSNSPVPGGYYLVVDSTVFGDNFKGDPVKNLSVLQVFSSGLFAPDSKVGVPTLKKEVKEVNDSVTVIDPWGSVADYDIGDDVEFRLTGTLPADYANYTKYQYIFHDTLSESLQLNVDSVKVKVVAKDGKETVLTKDKDYECVPGNNGKFTVTVGEKYINNKDGIEKEKRDLKKITTDADVNIVVEYSAKLLANFTYGKGIPNTAYLQYSNNPNYGGEDDTAETPEDKVLVYTFRLEVTKVTKEGDKNIKLEGAEFTLYKLGSGGATVEQWTISVGEDGSVEISGNDVVDESEENSAENIKNHDVVVTDGNVFTFNGLDAGDYKLVESKVPSGYNQADDMYFTVTAQYTNTEKKELTGLSVSQITDKDGNVIGNPAEGKGVFSIEQSGDIATLKTTIENRRGFLFPATGGIGTTIFYVIGGILIVGAGVLLIVKKRTDKSE